MLKEFNKDPQAELDYTMDWGNWLVPGDTIASAAWTVETGLIDMNQSFIVGAKCTVWLKGGTVGGGINGYYTVTCHVTTTGGRVDEESFAVRISQH